MVNIEAACRVAKGPKRKKDDTIWSYTRGRQVITTEKCFLWFNDVNDLTEGGGGVQWGNKIVHQCVQDLLCSVCCRGWNVNFNVFPSVDSGCIKKKKKKKKQNNHNHLKCENVSNGNLVMCRSAGFAPTLNSITSAPEANIAEQLLYDSSDSGCWHCLLTLSVSFPTARWGKNTCYKLNLT